MICLYCQDERERTQAFVSMALRCHELSTRLSFLGSEVACEAVRAAVCSIDASAGETLSFRPWHFSQHKNRTDEWDAMLAFLRSMLLEISAAPGHQVAWIDAPLPREGAPVHPAMRSYCAALGSVTFSVISAYLSDELPGAAATSLLQDCEITINAKGILPRCPAWLIDQTASSPEGRLPRIHTEESVLQSFTQIEKLVTLGQFAAGFAHELGNPLSIISSSLQYLHQRLAAANDPASEFTATALQNVERMHGLLRGMLDIAVAKRAFERTDLPELIAEVLRFTSAECARRSISVEVSFDPFLPKAWIEPSGTKQILLNLVKNGLDAIGQHSGTIRVRTRSGEENETAVVEFENSGPSIPDDVFPRLFKPFFTTKEGGTGLGLYLSRQMAKDNGGDLKVQNLPQGGVQFLLFLPLNQRDGGGS